MRRTLYIGALCVLAGCSTAQVQDSCTQLRDFAVLAQPYLVGAPPEVRAAATALSVASTACSSPEYAALRESVLAWLRTRAR